MPGPIDALTRIRRRRVAPGQRHTPRVAAFFDFMVAEVGPLRAPLSG